MLQRGLKEDTEILLLRSSPGGGSQRETGGKDLMRQTLAGQVELEGAEDAEKRVRLVAGGDRQG